MTPGKEETIQRILDVQPPYTTPMKLMSEAYDAALSQSAATHDKGLLQEAFTMIGMLRSFIACGETINKDDDVLIASVLDKLRIAGAQPLPVVSPPPTWSQIQLGLPLEQQNYLDDLAHGLVTKGALAWVCELVNKASGGTVSPTPPENDEDLADKLAPFLWEADEWWDKNQDRLVETADWAECVLLHMMPKLKEIMRGAVSPEPQEKR